MREISLNLSHSVVERACLKLLNNTVLCAAVCLAGQPVCGGGGRREAAGLQLGGSVDQGHHADRGQGAVQAGHQPPDQNPECHRAEDPARHLPGRRHAGATQNGQSGDTYTHTHVLFSPATVPSAFHESFSLSTSHSFAVIFLSL